MTNISDDGSDGIKAQLFSAAGDPIGAEFKVNLSTGSHFTSNVSALANGGFVISWDDWNGFDMKAQVFDANGARVGGVLTVNTRTNYAQEYGDIVGLAAAASSATLAATEHLGTTAAAIRSRPGLRRRRREGRRRVPGQKPRRSKINMDRTVEALAGGGFVLSGNVGHRAGRQSHRPEGQIFNASGAKVGGEFRITPKAWTCRGIRKRPDPDGGSS